MSKFAERLKERVDEMCASRGTSVEAMAKDLNLGRSRFRHYWERGSRPDHDVMVQIADYLEVDLNWLFGRDATREWPKVDPVEAIRQELSSIAKKIEG